MDFGYVIGEVRRGKELGYKSPHKHIWHACVDCGKERWVQIRWREPESSRCRSCANKLEKNPRWKGGRIKSSSGYILIKMREHIRADRYGYIPEHIVVWEGTHNKSLPEGWQIHHKNGIKDDNREENLEAMPHSQHAIMNLYNTNKTINQLQREIGSLRRENAKLREQLND